MWRHDRGRPWTGTSALQRTTTRTPPRPIAVSPTALARCSQELSPLAEVRPLKMSYMDGLREVTARRQPGETLLVLFLGSTIGNFEPDGAIDFLYAVRQVLSAGDAVLAYALP